MTYIYQRSRHKAKLFDLDEIRRASRFCKKAPWWWPFHRKGFRIALATVDGIYYCNKCPKCGVLTMKEEPS